MNLNNGMQPSFLTPSASSNNDESCNNDESWLVKCFRRETAAAPWQRQASPMPVAAWFYGFILLLLTDDSDKSAAGLTGGRMTVIVHWQWLSAAQHSWWKTHTDKLTIVQWWGWQWVWHCHNKTGKAVQFTMTMMLGSDLSKKLMTMTMMAPTPPKAVTNTCFQNHHGVMMISFQDSLHRFNRVFPTGPARGPILQSSTGTQPPLATLPAQGLVP